MIKKLCLLGLSLVLVLLASGDAAAAAFRQKESANFVVYYYKEDTAFAQDVLRTLEDNYDRITTALKVEISEKTPVYIYPDVDALLLSVFGQSLPSRAGVRGIFKDGTIHIVSYRFYGEEDYHPLLRTAVHEFAHAATYHVQPGAPSVPYLFEGLAVLLTGNWETEEMQGKIAQSVTRDIQNQTFSTIRRLKILRTNAEGFYLHSYLFVKYIAQEYGIDAVLGLHNNSNSIRSDAIPDIFNISTDELQDNWMRYIIDTYYIED